MPEQIALSPEELVALNRLTVIARVLSGAAHDINNALQIIGGSAEVLASNSHTGDAAQRTVQRIQGQAERAGATIHQLMTLARPAGDARSRLSLRLLVEQSLVLRRFNLRRAGIAVVFDEANAPSAQVFGSTIHLLQLILNLLLNAEQAVREQPEPMIGLTLSETDGQVNLCVSDNGGGIEAALAESVFGPFVTSRSIPDASGLGLTAVRIIAREHGGDVSLENHLTGCRASLHLPAVP